MLALGTFLPTIRLKDFGYSYNVVGTPAVFFYVTAVIVFGLNIVSVKVRNEVILQLQFVAIALFGGCLVYGLNLRREGIDWFASRLAYDAPTWQITNADAYWAKLNELTGGVTTVYGSLKTLYDTIGPRVTYNGAEIFADTINDLNSAQIRSLIDAAGLPFEVLHVGIFCLVAALIMQVGTFFMLRRM